MFPKCFLLFVVLVIVSSQLKGTACFFVKWFRGNSYNANYGDTSRNCIKDTGLIQSNGSWGNLSFLGFTGIGNSCLDPAAQFVFRDNGAMLNLKRQGCLAAFNRNVGSAFGYNLDMFYLYVDSVSLDTAACAQKPNESIYRAITMTSDGGLTVYYKFQTWCASYTYNSQLYQSYGIIRYMALSTQCNPGWYTDAQRFIFGSVTCHGDKVKNANCLKDQYMVVKFATYRGLLAPKKCGLSDDYSCEVDVTCLVKKQCDGLHECHITVNDTLFSGDQCPGLSNYLYIEYQCVDTVKPFKELCVYDVSLSYSSLPYEGVLQITTDNGTKNICWQSLQQNYNARHTVCRHLGYDGVYFFGSMSTSTNTKNLTFSGSINCKSGDKYLSQCSINASPVSETCSALSYIQCGRWLYYIDYQRPLLQRLPDSSFSATGSLQDHNASNVRISSGSSWCAPITDDTHYFQVDLGRLYTVTELVTYGDSSSSKWVATFNLSYTNELAMVNWKTISWNIAGNRNAYNHAAHSRFGFFKARILRFIPLTYVGQPCMRVEVWGATPEPDKPRNLIIFKVTSRSAEISWLDPISQGHSRVSRFLIELKKGNSLILNIITGKVNKYKINHLTSYTTYEISVAAGNKYGFSEETSTSFLTSEEVPRGSPLNITIFSRTTSSLLLTWDPPESSKRNGVIINYTACISHSENGPCFQTFTTSERKWFVGNLNPLTKYYVRVLASTKVGHGNYSESKEFFTSATWKPDKPRNLIITNVTSRSAEISWLDPISQGHSRVSHFLIELKKGNSLILNTITGKVNKYKINNLTPYTTYEISVAARNGYGSGEEISTLFLTSEEVPRGSPLNIKISSKITSSLSATWDPPENSTWNGVIISYTACISHSENGPCFQTLTTSKREWFVGNLNPSTKYYVRVLASTKVGDGNYSESKEFFTSATWKPDKPRNLIITNVTSRSAEISWLDPEYHGNSRVSHFLIELKKGNLLILNTITRKVNKYKINHLTPYTTYEISVAAGNYYDIGEEISTLFLTSEEVPRGSPLNIKIFSKTTSSLSLSWDLPENSKRNGVIISYTACISHSENGPCFQTLTTSEREWFVGNLNPSTKYYVRVLASTKVGHGNYSESKEFFTNESDVPGEKDDDSNKYLIGMIVAILVVILVVVIALYFHFRRISSDTEPNATEPNGEKTNDVKNPPHIYDDVLNYVQVLDEQSIYTTLNRPGEATDDHLYAHLNEVIQNMDADQKETGF